MTRFVALCVAVGVSIAGAGDAWAQAWPAGSTIKWERFSVKQGEAFVEPDQEDRRQFLNRAHCICAKTAPNDEAFHFQYDVSLSATSGTGATGEVWVGTQCDNDQNRVTMCRQLPAETIADIDTLAMPPVKKLRLNFFDVVNGPKNMDACVSEEGTKLVWILAKDNGNYVYTTSQGVGEVSGDNLSKPDTRPPEGLENLDVSGSENSIEINWTLSESNTDDYAYIQALCSHADDTVVFEADARPAARYQTAKALCGGMDDFQFGMTAVDLPDEEDVTTTKFADLPAEYLCGEQAAPASGSLKIEKLTNGTKYKVAVLAVDHHGNVIGTSFTKTVTPRPVTDFWEDLHDRGGAVEGGCLLSTTYGDGNPLTRTLREFRDGTLARSALGRWLTGAYYGTIGALAVESFPARIAVGIAMLPLVALALLWHLLGLPALLALLALPWLVRRRAALRAWLVHRRRLAAAIVTAGLLLAPGLAAADDFTPYWEDPSQEASLGEPSEVKWIAGIRVGPYIPDIDLQFPQNAATGMGPYEAMFGTYYTDTNGDGTGDKRHKKRVYQVLPMLDVERVVWRGFGQLGVGGTLGYMQKTAYAYENGTTEDDPMRPRSTAKNTFRLIPLAATVTYRFTYLDDRWGIPVIPYVRGGLAYYMWWIKGPNGTSEVCEGPAPEMCTNDKAYGGTPGVQASAGLAIRAERVDAAAAQSMRNSGIQHAGFYGEVFWGRVDGFGSETKLWVGDTTWFAGANFEF